MALPKKPEPSGGEKRKRAKAKKIEELIAAAAELGVKLVDAAGPRITAGPVPTALDCDLDRYRALGPPPQGAAGRVAWAGKVAAQLLEDTILDPGILEKDRRRVGKDLVAVIGMTQAKANVDEQLVELRALIDGRKRADELTSTDGIEFPATSRLGSTPPGNDETH